MNPLIRQLFCQACGIETEPVRLEAILAHLVNFCRLYKFDFQLTQIHMSWHTIILPKSEAWLVEEAGATPRESVMRAVATVYDNMQKSSLSAVVDIKSHKKGRQHESNEPTNR